MNKLFKICFLACAVSAYLPSHAQDSFPNKPITMIVPFAAGGSSDVIARITAEEIWACTTCKACDEICPVNIEITDKIFDMRRYLSLMESNFPAELGNAYRAMENQSNPWGMNQGERGDWADGIDGVTIVDPGEALTSEYLYWVGCAGSFDDKNKKVTQATAKLLRRAGIEDVATDEVPQRRNGNPVAATVSHRGPESIEW